jgi:WD40 repeat protein
MPAMNVTWLRDGDWLLHGGQGGAILEADTGRMIDVLHNPIDRHHFVALSAAGDTIAESTSNVVGVRLFHLGESGLTLRFPGHRRFLSGVALGADGRSMVTTSPYDGLTRVWSLSAARPDDLRLARVQEFEGGKDAAAKPNQVALSPDGALFATASLYGRTELRRLPDGALLQVIQEASDRQTYSAWDVQFSPDGNWLYSAAEDGRILRWSIAESEFDPPLRCDGGQVFSLAFSGEGRQLAAGAKDGSISIWDLTDESKEPVMLRGHRGLISGLSFAPDGVHLASAGWDATLRIWDLRTGTAIEQRHHELWVNRCQYSPDGRFLASASDDNTVRLWSTQDYRLLQVFRCVEQANFAIFSPDGRYLYMNDGTDLARHRITVDERIEDPGELLRQAERAAGMQLQGLELVPIR